MSAVVVVSARVELSVVIPLSNRYITPIATPPSIGGGGGTKNRSLVLHWWSTRVEADEAG